MNILSLMDMKMEWLFFPCALLCGFGLDLLLGDPEHWPHPVRGMGKLIEFGERRLRGGGEGGPGQAKGMAPDLNVRRDKMSTGNVGSAGGGLAEFERSRETEKAGDELAEFGCDSVADRAGEYVGAERNSESLQRADSERGASGSGAGRASEYTGAERNSESLRRADSERGVKRDKMKGLALVVIVVGATALASAAVLWLCFMINIWLAFALTVFMSWQCVSVRCLAREALNVFGFLNRGDLTGARRALSMIVGRDVDALDKEGVSRAAVETVAENTADGVIAPLFFMALGGPCLGMVYKAVSTLDSMIGYKNERYLAFGGAAARLDDFAAYAPSRLAALCMIAASRILGQDGRGALRVWLRDRRKHASPNSAQCEAALAGALGVALGGNASYSGKAVNKPVIGDAGRPVAPADIKTATRILYGTSFIFLPAAFFISAGVSALALYLCGMAT